MSLARRDVYLAPVLRIEDRLHVVPVGNNAYVPPSSRTLDSTMYSGEIPDVADHRAGGSVHRRWPSTKQGSGVCSICAQGGLLASIPRGPTDCLGEGIRVHRS